MVLCRDKQRLRVGRDSLSLDCKQDVEVAVLLQSREVKPRFLNSRAAPD